MGTGTLYLVATPIGNLGDLTPRAADVLRAVDFIAAEDTRVSQKLLAHLALHKPMISYYEHNRRQRGEEIAGRIAAGETCALVTDAGTPAVSDPGQELVALCAARQIPVIPLPGACAAVCALSVSGLPSERWCFEGFLPAVGRERRERLAAISRETRTMILYEAPHRLRTTLDDLAQACGKLRGISLSRELTKLHEETMRGTLGGMADCYETREPRGEYVLVLAGCPEGGDEAEHLEQAVRQAQAAVADGAGLKEAARDAADAFGVRKNVIYQRLLQKK